MGFLNPKERIIDIKLTQKGRELLSQGKLKVKFFSLFDDEVDYKNTSLSGSL
jgi:hypothetical protein